MRVTAFWAVCLLIVLSLACVRGGGIHGKLSKDDSLRVELENLTKQISGNEKDAGLLHERAKLYIALREINQALNDINKALQIAEKKADYYLTLSDIYLMMGQPQNCEQSLLKAVSVDPKNISANLKLADLYLIVKDYKKVDQYVKEVLTLDKASTSARFTRAMAFLETGDTALAIGDLMDAVKLNQSFFDAYMLLGELFATHKDPLAAGYFTNALRIRPASKEALYNLGMFYQESGQYPKAIGTYEVLSRVDTTFRDAPYNIGYINLVYLQDFKAAVEYFTKAIKLDPEYAESWYNRGLSYEQLKEYQKAYDDYQKTLKLKVNYEKAIEGMNRLDKLMKK
ncbi:MAG: tetratricopeptide repeat protein [Bacteroidetes bacterium]|nr:tetratricopeptide repeat protein [Bacteroidota bacterium]